MLPVSRQLPTLGSDWAVIRHAAQQGAAADTASSRRGERGSLRGTETGRLSEGPRRAAQLSA